MIKELAQSLKTDDKLLRRLWAKICEDHGWTRPEQKDDAAMERFIDNLPDTKATSYVPSCMSRRPLREGSACRRQSSSRLHARLSPRPKPTRFE